MGAGLCTLAGMNSLLQFGGVAANPFRMRRLRREQWEAGQPAFARSRQVAMGLKRPGARRQLLDLIATNQGLAVGTRKRSSRNGPVASRAILEVLRTNGSHVRQALPFCIISYRTIATNGEQNKTAASLR